MTVALSLGQFIVDHARRPLSPEVNAHAIRALVDWTGVTIAGWRGGPALLLREALGSEIGSGSATLLTTPPASAHARTAALLNGTASHTIELDDIYSPGLYHPGCPTIAAALAVAEQVEASGSELLTAIAIGYQVGNWVAKAVQPTHYCYWHTTGTIGCIGAAAAAVSLLGVKATAAGHALATSVTFVAGLQQAFRSDSMSKPLHAGRAAEAGVLAAFGAARGLTGEAAMFEGPVGLGAAMSDAVDWEAALPSLTEGWTICESTHKIHACCGHAFSPIDGALALRDSIGDPEHIERILVETYPVAIEVAGIPQPVSPFEAKFSIPFGIASAIVHGDAGIDAFCPGRLADPVMRRLMAKIELTALPEFAKAYPAMRPAAVTIERSHGPELRHVQPTRRGSPTYPLSDAELHDKFLSLASPSLKQAGAQALLRQMLDMGSAPQACLDIKGPVASGSVKSIARDVLAKQGQDF